MNHFSRPSEYTTTLQKVKVPAGELKIGMYVCELDRPWLESPFLFQGFELTSDADIKAVQEICEYVYVDVRKQKLIKPPSPARKAKPSTIQRSQAEPIKSLVPFEREIKSASTTYQQTSRLIKTLIDDIRFGHSIDIQVAKAAVSECVGSILRNPDALMLLTQLKVKDEYTSQHSFNVCVYSIALGRHLRLPVKSLEDLGLCGLLHDMGKMRTPLEILNKEGKLEKEEFEIMKRHTTHGRDILISSRTIYPGAVDVAFGHHERLDGSGYPRGLNAAQIPPYAKVVAVVDTYDAITSNRVYQQGRSHMEALNILNKASGNHFSSDLVVKFIECIGIYPPGSLVELGNGEVAIVIENNPRYKTKPKLMLLLDEEKKPRNERVIDLAKLDLDASGQPYRIKAILPPDAHGLDIHEYYQKGILLKTSGQ